MGTAAGNVTATQMPLWTLLCALGHHRASPRRSTRPGKGELCPAPGPHSLMCSWALGRLGEALSLCTLDDVGPATLSPSWKQLGLPSTAQPSPIPPDFELVPLLGPADAPRPSRAGAVAAVGCVGWPVLTLGLAGRTSSSICQKTLSFPSAALILFLSQN